MASIKRELQVTFKTTGDGQVVRSIQTVDSALVSTEKAGKGAATSIGDLSEQMSGKLEGSVGKVFKVTDALNGILGKATAAFGLLGLAAGAAVAVYNAFTKSSAAAASGQSILTERMGEVRRAMEEARKETERAVKAEQDLAAASGVRLALIDPSIRKQVQQNAETIRQAELTIDATRKTVESQKADREERVKGLAVQKQQLIAMAAAERADIIGIQTAAARLAAETEALEFLDKTIDRNELLVGNQQAAIRTAEAWTKGLVSGVKEAEGLGKAVETKTTPAIKALTAATQEASASLLDIVSPALLPQGGGMLKSLGLAPEDIDSARGGLSDIIAMAEATEINPLAKALGIGKVDISSALAETSEGLALQTEQLAAFGDASVRAFGDAAAAALVYGASFGEVAAQAIASLAARAVSEALYQGALALAYLGAGLFTGSPKAFAAAKTAAASAAAFAAVAAVTVPVARATGSADGGGTPSGPSARDAGTDRAERGGGGDNITINLGNQRVFATEADVGRGRPRLQRATMGA